MDLEEMKTLWIQMSLQVEKQKKITDSLIIKMTQVNYRNKINKIWIPEAISSVFAFIAIAFIVTGFQKLNTWYLVICGMVTMVILFLLPVLSLRSIYRIRSLQVLDKNYKESLLAYSKARIHFVFVQKLSFYLGSVLILTVVPVVRKLINGMDFFKETKLWFAYVIGFPFYYFIAKWVFKYYIKSAADAENILKELQD
ncbi:MAG: hypothetical protein ABJB86_09925 [Bacteroidota bacterium]